MRHRLTHNVDTVRALPVVVVPVECSGQVRYSGLGGALALTWAWGLSLALGLGLGAWRLL